MDNQTNHQKFPLLSVCIRAHNIEKELLDRCISSVVHQTYTNIEIILVNNANKDDTGIYCDSWSQKDHRIRVIHSQENKTFLEPVEYATGDYIHILDNDDWLASDMYSKMMSAMLSTNSDIARCEFCFAYPDGQIVHRNITHNSKDFEVIGREEGVLLLLENNKWQSYYWQNIFKKQIFKHHIPLSDKEYDDLSCTHILFNYAFQTVYLHDVFYFYYQRPGSKINPLNIQGKVFIKYCRYNSIYKRYLFVKQHPQYHNMLQPIKKEVVFLNIWSLWNMIEYPQYFTDNAYEMQVEQLKQFSLSLQDGILFFLNLDLLILKKNPRCYKPFYKIFYRNLKRIYYFTKACFKSLQPQNILRRINKTEITATVVSIITTQYLKCLCLAVNDKIIS